MCVTHFHCREDAFQEYVELETVYFDCLDTTAAAAAPATRAEAAAAAVREAADFGALAGPWKCNSKLFLNDYSLIKSCRRCSLHQPDTEGC